MKFIFKLTCLLVISSFFLRCNDLSVTGVDPSGLSFVIPVIDTQFKLLDIADRTDNDSYFKVDPEGNIILIYEGQLVKNNAISLFPPLPGIINFEITDTIDEVPLPLPSNYIADKGVFAPSNITFIFNTSYKRDYTVDLTFPTITKNGATWSKQFLIDSTGSYVSESSQLQGWSLLLSNNSIPVTYTAQDLEGNTIDLDYAAFKFDIIYFTQIEGYFGHQNFDIKGDVINVGLFSNWVDGTIVFDDPKLSIKVENSFGFPVKSKVNSLYFTLVDGTQIALESQFVDDGIDFNYPNFDEFGEVKITEFSFNKANSNIGELFGKKVTSIVYDLDAIANPDDRERSPNFIRDDSYFSVDVNLELPLDFTIDKFTIQDTLDLPSETFSDIVRGQVLVNYANAYPLDFQLHIFAVKDQDVVGILLDEPISIKANEGVSQINKSKYNIDVGLLQEDMTYISQIVVDQTSYLGTKNNIVLSKDHFLDLKVGLQLEY